MNNKKTGSEFEKEFCNMLSKRGYWVHFLSPDNRGAQPFDIIAVKNGLAVAIDCKTSVKPIFDISRLEDNQIMAFEKWISCGNSIPYIAIKYDDNVYLVRYSKLKRDGKIDFRRDKRDAVYRREKDKSQRAD